MRPSLFTRSCTVGVGSGGRQWLHRWPHQLGKLRESLQKLLRMLLMLQREDLQIIPNYICSWEENKTGVGSWWEGPPEARCPPGKTVLRVWSLMMFLLLFSCVHAVSIPRTWNSLCGLSCSLSHPQSTLPCFQKYQQGSCTQRGVCR